MKRLLSLSLAVLLFASSALAADPSIEAFIQDPEVNKVAPHLLQEIHSEGIDTAPASVAAQDNTFFNDPALDSLVSAISVSFFQPGAQDWSSLEKARLDAIQNQGDENVKKWADLSAVDAGRASILVNTIYDAVLTIPQVTEKEHEAKKEAENTSNLWDFLGASLVKTADFFKKAKGVVAPTPTCETSNEEYSKGAEEVIYYSSLTHGLAGGLLASAPQDAPVKSVDLKDIVEAVGRLAIETQMAQNIARLSGLDPKENAVRLITLLGLAAVGPDSEMALAARDIYAMIKQGISDRIPAAVSKALSDQAAYILITKGAGERGNSLSAENAPILRNVVAFSSDVLAANGIGDTLKYVFCPEMQENEKTSTIVDQEEPTVADADADAPAPAAEEAQTPPKDAEAVVADAPSDASKAGDQKVFQVPDDKAAAEKDAADKDAADKAAADKAAAEKAAADKAAAEKAAAEKAAAEKAAADKAAADKAAADKAAAEKAAAEKAAAEKAAADKAAADKAAADKAAADKAAADKAAAEKAATEKAAAEKAAAEKAAAEEAKKKADEAASGSAADAQKKAQIVEEVREEL